MIDEDGSVPMVVGAGVALGALFYGLIWSVPGFGINVFLMQVAFVATTAWLTRRAGRTLPREAWVAAAFSLAFAGTFAIWTSDLALGVAFVCLMVSEAAFILYAIGHHFEFHHPALFAHAAFVMTPIHALGRLGIFRHLPLPSRAPAQTRSIVVGLLALVPVLLVFGTLFASADPLFGDYVRNVLNFSSVPDWTRYAVGTLFWSVAFASLLGLAFWKRETFASHVRPSPQWHVESNVVLCGVIGLFALFIAVQATYLFGGEAAFLATDYTFSEYARRGFNELVTVATIVLFLFLSLRYLHGDRASNILRVLYGILFGETLLVLLSAIIRMNLYVDAYGYTASRLFAYAFLTAVATLIVVAFVHVLRNEPQPRFIRQGLVVTGIFALAFVVSAPDARSMSLNENRFRQNGGISLLDIIYASEEAYPVMRDMEARGIVAYDLEPSQELTDTEVNAEFPIPRPDWRQWNFSKSRIDPSKPYPWLGCLTPECTAAEHQP